MPLVKVGEKHQVTIPIDIFNKLHLKAGDVLDVNLRNNTVVLVPSQVIPKEDAWFRAKEWQEKEAEADEDIAKGRVSKVYTDVKELIKDLES